MEMPTEQLKTIEFAAEARTAPVRVKRLDLFPVSIPLVCPMKMSGVLIRCAENLLVRVETTDGGVGWGEAASAPTMTGETLWGMVSAAQLLWHAIDGADLRFRAALSGRLARALYGNEGAKSAIELALLDAAGHSLKISAAELLGGRCRDRLEPMWMLGNMTVDEDVAEAVAKREAGYRFFKLKVGSKALADDIAATLAVRQALGPDMLLCADANGGLDFTAAVRLLRDTQAANLLFLEQPLPAGMLSSMARLQALNLAPLSADEGIHGVADVEQHAACGAAQGVSLKLIKLGGPVALLKAAGRACDLGLALNIAAKVAETSLASAAAAHLACAVDQVTWGISLTQIYLEHDPVVQPMLVENGAVRPPDGPGLGIEVDEGAVRHYRAPSP
jgi:muconate cycloisomerase